MRLLKGVKFIVVHCADTKSSMNVTVNDLRQWHVTDNGWSDIGYHYFIKFDGSRYVCRSEKYQGAHCRTVNDKSIAVCLEGGHGGIDNFTEKQKQSLVEFLGIKKVTYKDAVIVGHGHFDDKLCPSFDVVGLYEDSLKNG
tara:strand:- start:22 stop:441 length:420 start_codon:yes stop_codon:yes gene_type:complete